jgi:PAS domain S-box-containing protein
VNKYKKEVTHPDGIQKENLQNSRQYLDIAGVMILVLDSDQRVTLINKKGCETLGYPENKIIGKNWFDNFLPKEITNEVKSEFLRLIKGKEPDEFFENPILNKDGEERIIYWHSSLLYNKNGIITGVLSSGEDITEFRKIQIELRRHSETMETLYSLSQEIGDSLDLNDMFTRIGKNISNNTSVLGGGFYIPDTKSAGYSLASTFGNEKYSPFILTTLEKRGSYTKKILEKQNGYKDEIKIQLKGKEIDVKRFSISMKSAKEIIGIMTLFLKDFDEYTLNFIKLAASESGRGINKKNAEAEQALSEEKFFTIFQTSPDSISISNIEDGTYLAVNEKFTEITGFTNEEVIGKPANFIEGWQNPENREKFIEELNEKGKVTNFETVLKRKDGFFNVLMSAKVIEYNGRKSMLTVVKDITDRIKAEKEILATKEMLEKITYTSPAFISLHDLKLDRTLYSNKSILKSVGYKGEEIKKIAKTLTEDRLFLYHPDDVKTILESDKKILELKDGEVLKLEFRLKNKDGIYHWFRQSSAVYQRDKNGASTQSVNVFEDITEKKNAEEQIEKRNKELNLLYETGKNLSGTLDLTELYDRMYDSISEVTDCDELFVTTYNTESQLLRYFYLKSKHSKERISVNRIPPIPLAPPGYGILSEAIRSGESRIINDYQENYKKVKTKYTIDEKGEITEENNKGEYKPLSAMIVPIKLESKIFGVVHIYSAKKNAFTNAQLNFVESLINLVALANNNAILYQKAQDEIKERKIAEESLRKSEERLRHFSESVPDVLYRIDLINKKYDFLTPSLEKMLGYPLEMTLKNPLEFTEKVLHPDDKKKVLKLMNEFIHKGTTDKPFELEARMIRKDGRVIWVRDVIRFTWQNGKPVSANGIMSDISVRKLEEEKRRLRNEQIIEHQAALLEMSKLTGMDIQTSEQDINEITAKTLNIDRSSIWLFNKDHSEFECQDMYFSESGIHKSGMSIYKTSFNKFFELISSEDRIYHVVSNASPETAEFEKEYFSKFGTNSAIFSTIRQHGDIAGFVCYESKKKNSKDWTTEQLDYIASTSNIISIAIESDERQRAERETLKSLKDKELLLREIHHRVKNNLAVISSLLYLQSQKTQNKQVLDALKESQLRIKSMVLVHEKLYQSKDLSSINYSEYIETLAGTLFRSYETERRKISLELDVNEIYLDTDIASNLGLIINELISNSIKHAFPGNREGIITISLKLIENGKYILIVKDNGVGVPSGFDVFNTDSLGLKLVSTLVEQINGTLEFDRTDGACFKIKFSQNN